MAGKYDHLKLVEKNNRPSAWKRFSRFLIKAFILAGLLVLLWQGESYFRVTAIRVEGANELKTEEILQAGGISKGMSIFMIGEGDISSRIKEQLPRVEKIAIRRDLPDTVVIEIKERSPAGYVMTADGFWLIDDQAVVMAYRDEPQKNYPLISGIDGRKVIPGFTIDCPARAEALVNFFSGWSGKGELAIERLDLQESYNLIAYTVDGLEIWFGEGKDLSYKMQLIEESLPYIDPDTEARLDVRCGKRLVVSGSAVTEKKGREVDP